MFTVVLDACTLVPITLCDTSLRIAETGSFSVRWSATILDEVERTMVGKLNVPAEAAARRVQAMDKAFRFAEVRDHERFEHLLTNDPKDRHVLACVITAQVHTIVTFNLKDFPQSSLDPWGIEAARPDQFLLDQLDLAPMHVTHAIHTMVESSSQPPRTADSILRALARSGVPDFANELRRHITIR